MLSFIDDHYQERLNLTEIAHAAHVGRSECSRCFQKTLATLPMRYLQEYRLEKAAKLLTTTPLPISVIANQVGFEAGPFFSQCFKRRTGVPPASTESGVPKCKLLR
ncbi:helix-turn-helix domain-containing protein [Limosilactobacillus fermentum]|uniref:helix-turn-helix domain-containing protein n=1 Tax=Limosilactobacillus fermentum TaxID=1613 RepID=UPI0019D63FB1|nr:helix-turn-helix transcriptional regulator [Limosilactobacillus fermentum]